MVDKTGSHVGARKRCRPDEMWPEVLKAHQSKLAMYPRLQEIASKDESGKLFEASEEEAYLHILIKSKSY